MMPYVSDREWREIDDYRKGHRLRVATFWLTFAVLCLMVTQAWLLVAHIMEHWKLEQAVRNNKSVATSGFFNYLEFEVIADTQVKQSKN